MPKMEDPAALNARLKSSSKQRREWLEGRGIPLEEEAPDSGIRQKVSPESVKIRIVEIERRLKLLERNWNELIVQRGSVIKDKKKVDRIVGQMEKIEEEQARLKEELSASGSF